MVAPTLRGTTLGAVLGILPGAGAALASFGAYALEKKVSKNADQIGSGAIEGVAAPEAANNAGAQMSFVPMLTLGMPSNAVMALMIGAMIVKDIQPGPTVMTQQPALFWGLIASMWVGNLMLLVLNLPLIGLWVRMIQVPYRYLYPAIIVFCAIGVFSLSNVAFDLQIMMLFGLLGYVFKKLDCEPVPMLLGFILGPGDGGVPASHAAHLARRSDGARAAADQRRAAHRGGRTRAPDPEPVIQPDTRHGIEGGVRGRVGNRQSVRNQKSRVTRWRSEHEEAHRHSAERCTLEWSSHRARRPRSARARP